MQQSIKSQIDELVTAFQMIQSQYGRNYERVPEVDAARFVTAGMNVIHRATGNNSIYSQQVAREIDTLRSGMIAQVVVQYSIPIVAGTLQALQHDIDRGYLDTYAELIHASVFTNFLEMAQHLHSEGYKDAAAVLAGGILEEHLRKLCEKSSMSVETPDSSGGFRPKKAEALNTDLASANVYGKLDQKSVTAWLDLRNKAAHARYSEYTSDQVDLFIQGIRHFLVRFPA